MFLQNLNFNCLFAGTSLFNSKILLYAGHPMTPLSQSPCQSAFHCFAELTKRLLSSLASMTFELSLGSPVGAPVLFVIMSHSKKAQKSCCEFHQHKSFCYLNPQELDMSCYKNVWSHCTDLQPSYQLVRLRFQYRTWGSPSEVFLFSTKSCMMRLVPLFYQRLQITIHNLNIISIPVDEIDAKKEQHLSIMLELPLPHTV